MEMCKRIIDIERRRTLRNRSERAMLDKESEKLQDIIDAVFFTCYGLTGQEANYVDKRLQEML